MNVAVIVRLIISGETFHAPPEGLTVIPAGCRFVRSLVPGGGPGSSIWVSLQSIGCAEVSVNSTANVAGVLEVLLKARVVTELETIGLLRSVIDGGIVGAGCPSGIAAGVVSSKTECDSIIVIGNPDWVRLKSVTRITFCPAISMAFRPIERNWYLPHEMLLGHPRKDPESPSIRTVPPSMVHNGASGGFGVAGVK